MPQLTGRAVHRRDRAVRLFSPAVTPAWSNPPAPVVFRSRPAADASGAPVLRWHGRHGGCSAGRPPRAVWPERIGPFAAGRHGGSLPRCPEFLLTPQPSSAPAGKVTFKAVNDGKVTHELVVLNTDKAPGGLPVARGKADETGDLGEAENIAAGTSKSVTLALKPGHYVLICNLAGHYQAGIGLGVNDRR
jgi:hypothetical protein